VAPPSAPHDDPSPREPSTPTSEIAALRQAVGDLADEVRRQSRLIEELRDTIAGLTQAEADPTLGSGPTQVELWQRLGLTDGERRNVTVLFADVSGFTALAETLDPEECQLIMQDTMSALTAVVTGNDGYLEKFIGDALCAIFGAPIAHDDEPERAVRSAVAMHRLLAERSARRPDLPPLGIHIGINTGIVVAGMVGDGTQYGVMGDTINTASRLMGLAEAGETFLSFETARRVRREFRLEDRGRFEVKGKAQALAAFNVLGELGPDDPAMFSDRRSPIVGLGEHRDRLRSLAVAAAGGTPAVALIAGSRGTGKTRLLDDLGEWAAGSFTISRGSARVQGETSMGLIDAALGSVVPGLSITAFEGAADGDGAMTDGLAAAIVELAAGRPLAVLLDDLDLAEDGSLEVLAHLVELVDAPVLWVFAARRLPPRIAQLADRTAPGRRGSSRDTHVVRLGPLHPAHLAELAEALVPGAFDDTYRDRLATLADGNAEFVEEIVLSLIDEGVVVEGADGRWEVVGDLDLVALPTSVTELVEARMDGLATAARLTLQDAAVIGLHFTERLLEKVTRVPAQLDAALAELAAAELIAAPAGGDGPVLWSFRSRLVRDVAYESLLRRRRPLAHRAAADALIALGEDTSPADVELVAHHLALGDDPVQALPYLRRAADHALARNATDAESRLRQALQIAEEHDVDDADVAWFREQLDQSAPPVRSVAEPDTAAPSVPPRNDVGA